MKAFVFTLFLHVLSFTPIPICCSRSPMQTFHFESANLTRITWAHAVNSKALLEEALNSEKRMLEADVVLGRLIDQNSSESIPIMGHPPATSSDLSLQHFLDSIQLYNSHNRNDSRGVKLDFKSIEVFEKSVPIIEQLHDKMDYPLWLNADILAGPVNASTLPVDPEKFLKGAEKFADSVLSIGWTTQYGISNYPASYTEEQITGMLEVVKNNHVKQNVTYPVRAGIAAESFELMKRLVEETGNSTLTVWSSLGDRVNVENLRGLIFGVGLNKVYVDVPESLLDQLHLDEPTST